MNYPSRKGELIIGLVALAVIIAVLVLSMFFTWYAEQYTPPQVKIKTTVHDYNFSDGAVNRLIWEEGPGYKRMQYQSRVTMGLTRESESIYAEAKE